ncbi:MAG: hypothetical protein J6Z17_00475 [Treponema sp.]|nr:hypothetical protein [Treponema sp.]
MDKSFCPENKTALSHGLLKKAIIYNSENAINEKDGIFSINRNIGTSEIELDSSLKELVDSILRS